MKYEYIDIHSHLNFPKYDADREEVIQKLAEAKIATITVGTNFETSKESVELAEKHSHLFSAVGVHPQDIPQTGKIEEWSQIVELARSPKVVAIGECGLDYSQLPENELEKENVKRIQREVFEEHIALAVACNKPLMIHCRDAYEDALVVLAEQKERYGDALRANFHFFTEPVQTAKRILDLGFQVSFTGVITFVPEYAEIVASVPISKIMAETDAPFAAPAPYRGKRNEPSYVMYVVQKIAEIKKMDIEEVKRELLKNVHAFFGI